MYYFCNFIEKKLSGYDKKGINLISISDNLNEVVQLAKCFQINENGFNSLNFVSVNEQSKGSEIDFLGKFSSDKVGSTDNELLSTDENPIIIVATKKFEVYNGIPTYIKYFPVQGGVLVALIKGFISVESRDGQMLPLSRNCDVVANCVANTYTAEDMKKLNILEDKNSGLKFSNYVVSDCIISHTVAKDGGKLKSVKFNKENFVVLNKDVFIEAKNKKEAELRAIEEEKKRRAEEVARFNENYKLRMQQEEENKKAKAKESKPRKTSKNEKVVSGSDGAQAFLNIIASL